MKSAFFPSAPDFRQWLQEHHASAAELQVGFRRKQFGRSMTYHEALDEALAYGWIDGVRKGIDEQTYTIRFTPRKANSLWSQVNIQRVEELISRERMHAAGLRAFRERQERKPREIKPLEPALEATLHANPKARSFFEAQPPGYRKLITLWIMSAKKEKTRARRLAHLIELSAKETRIDLLKPRAQP